MGLRIGKESFYIRRGPLPTSIRYVTLRTLGRSSTAIDVNDLGYFFFNSASQFVTSVSGTVPDGELVSAIRKRRPSGSRQNQRSPRCWLHERALVETRARDLRSFRRCSPLSCCFAAQKSKTAPCRHRASADLCRPVLIPGICA